MSRSDLLAARQAQPSRWARGPRWSALARSIARCDVVGPAVLVAVVCVLAIAVKLHDYGGNPTGFVQFGDEAAMSVRPPPGALVLTRSVGYDGQFYYVFAAHPQIDANVRRAFALAKYRIQRVAYPALAAGASLGNRGALPWTLLAVNVLAAVCLVLATAHWCRQMRRSGWWALAIGLAPGVVLCLLRDLTDIVGLAALIAGLCWWSQGRWRLASAALVLAVLGRETALLALAAIAYDLAERRRAGRPAAGSAWVLGAPAAAFLAWEAYATVRFHGTVPLTTSPGSLWQPPGVGLTKALGSLAGQSPSHAGWDLLFAALTVAAVIVGIMQLRDGAHWLALLTTAQALLTVLLGRVFWLDHWSFTRATLPLFALVLLNGLRTRTRIGPLICCAAAALTLAVPVVLGTNDQPSRAAAVLNRSL